MLPKIKLAPLSVDHLAHVMSWINDHEVMQYFANRRDDVTEAEERAYLERLVTSPTDRASSVFDEAGAYV